MAQNTPGRQIWYTYNQQARLSQRWGYQFDINYRNIAISETESEIAAARAGFSYIANEKFRVTAGYAWFGQNTKNDNKKLLAENRLWQQLMWNKNRKGFSYFHRIRLEERFRQVYHSGSKVGSDYTTRLRYMLQLQGNLRSPTRPNGFAVKWQVADEIMLHAGEQVKQHYFEQNRVIGGITLAPSSAIELALLYQYSLQYLPVPECMEQLHTLRLTLLHAIDFRSKEK
jgi:hypothetical protein